VQRKAENVNEYSYSPKEDLISIWVTRKKDGRKEGREA
jgi:hypothetical protein